MRALPIEDPPETFGLHPNADITFQQKETNNLLETIILMGGGGGGGGGGSGGGGGNADQKVSSLAISIAERMPEAFDVRKGHPEAFKMVSVMWVPNPFLCASGQDTSLIFSSLSG